MTKNKELQPIMVEQKPTKLDFKQLNNIANDLQSSIKYNDPNDNTNESFFKAVINKLFDHDNIETKTEYLNVTENFVGTKLSYLSEFGNMPYLDNFIKIFERKRISLQRKGRKELVMALQEKQRELEQDNANKLRSMFGL